MGDIFDWWNILNNELGMQKVTVFINRLTDSIYRYLTG